MVLSRENRNSWIERVIYCWWCCWQWMFGRENKSYRWLQIQTLTWLPVAPSLANIAYI